jgi:hypothetical protein
LNPPSIARSPFLTTSMSGNQPSRVTWTDVKSMMLQWAAVSKAISQVHHVFRGLQKQTLKKQKPSWLNSSSAQDLIDRTTDSISVPIPDLYTALQDSGILNTSHPFWTHAQVVQWKEALDMHQMLTDAWNTQTAKFKKINNQYTPVKPDPPACVSWADCEQVMIALTPTYGESAAGNVADSTPSSAPSVSATVVTQINSGMSYEQLVSLSQSLQSQNLALVKNTRVLQTALQSTARQLETATGQKVQHSSRVARALDSVVATSSGVAQILQRKYAIYQRKQQQKLYSAVA